MYNRNSFYDGKQKYKVVEGTVKDHRIIADGFTSQKAVSEFYRDYKKEHGKGSTRTFFTIAYK